MKNIIYFLFLASFAIAVTACSNKPQRPSSVLSETQKAYTGENEISAPPATPPPGAEPPQNSAGVWHYTCSTGCAGGAGSAVPCGTCGSTLVHNSIYHSTGDKAKATPPTTPNAITATPGADGIPPLPPTTKTPEPPQNAAGVWHYTCSAGCAGGAGSAVPCSGCGATLAHNTSYHDK